MTSALRYFLILLIVALLSLSGSFGYLVYTIVEMDYLPARNPALTTRIYDCNDQLLEIRYVENRIEVPLERISSYLVGATIAVEDRRFFQHFGFDLSGLGRAILSNIKSGQTTQGGSTITQQLAKNLYLTHSRTIQRKLQEAIYTIHLERNYSKQEILEKYLNTIYYGHAAYGVEAAAQTYFGKSAAELSLSESALLAGLPRGPYYYSPYIHHDAALQRQQSVLNQMVETGMIGEAEKEAALQEELVFREPGGEQYSSYFIDHVINIVLAELFDGDINAVYRGGLEIYTTIDPQMQQIAQEIINSISLHGTDHEGVDQPQGALVAIDPVTGHVRAMAGGRDFKKTPLNRVFSVRSPGSSFKPFLYAAALESGLTVADGVMCEPVTYEEAGLREPYSPTDYGGDFHHRELTLREALATSCNVAAIKIHDAIGREKTAEMAARLGINSELPHYLSLPLGTREVTLLELTAAFAPFANGGYRIEPVFIRKVVDAQGTILYENRPLVEKVLDENIAFLVTDMLKGVLQEGGTASSAGAILTRPAAGKSGTSHKTINIHMVGYTPDLVTGLYIGDDHEEPLGISGGRVAAPLWAHFMEEALRDLPARDFTKPAGLIEASLCPETGLLACPYCEEVVKEYFIAGTMPVEYCDPKECSLCKPSLPRPLLPWLYIP